ncbi:polysaccharide pyruvyl transferase family protein [Streptomyces sp. TP-A0874]|uniref:polysaccharide pyruvyl transferase family protein n=1 Tax=Streptomyces sp. TP-A0874 TaxID=549819 RepID=UPI00099FA7E2|nr:polysaccharide pyruvyl transferase family protein [Streptomyces sp. TP-A0874]
MGENQPAPTVPGTLDELRGATAGRRRTLLTGWFSFRDGEATAGDVLAWRLVSERLDCWGVLHDTAWSPGFAPGALHLADVDPAAYDQLLFVCGPAHGPRVAELHRRFSRCHRVAVDVSVVDPADPAVTGFHRVLPRDGPTGPSRTDLSVVAVLGDRPPVAGVILSGGQGEYGGRRRHSELSATLTRWIGERDCTPVEADTRLDTRDWRHCATPEQLLALLERLDIVLTTRLHGMVLALRVGTPVLAVDPVRGGAKVSAQASALRWPALLQTSEVTETALGQWWEWCLSPAGLAAARRRSRLLRHRRRSLRAG